MIPICSNFSTGDAEHTVISRNKLSRGARGADTGDGESENTSRVLFEILKVIMYNLLYLVWCWMIRKIPKLRGALLETCTGSYRYSLFRRSRWDI